MNRQRDAARAQTPASPSPVNDSPSAVTSQSGSPLTFFVPVFALSTPFWLIGAVAVPHLVPGLPVAALMFVGPVTASAIPVYRENETAEMNPDIRPVPCYVTSLVEWLKVVKNKCCRPPLAG